MALPVPRPLPIVCLVIFATRYVPPYARIGEMVVMPLKKVMPAGLIAISISTVALASKRSPSDIAPGPQLNDAEPAADTEGAQLRIPRQPTGRFGRWGLSCWGPRPGTGWLPLG